MNTMALLAALSLGKFTRFGVGEFPGRQQGKPAPSLLSAALQAHVWLQPHARTLLFILSIICCVNFIKPAVLRLCCLYFPCLRFSQEHANQAFYQPLVEVLRYSRLDLVFQVYVLGAGCAWSSRVGRLVCWASQHASLPLPSCHQDGAHRPAVAASRWCHPVLSVDACCAYSQPVSQAWPAASSSSTRPHGDKTNSSQINNCMCCIAKYVPRILCLRRWILAWLMPLGRLLGCCMGYTTQRCLLLNLPCLTAQHAVHGSTPDHLTKNAPSSDESTQVLRGSSAHEPSGVALSPWAGADASTGSPHIPSAEDTPPLDASSRARRFSSGASARTVTATRAGVLKATASAYAILGSAGDSMPDEEDGDGRSIAGATPASDPVMAISPAGARGVIRKRHFALPAAQRAEPGYLQNIPDEVLTAFQHGARRLAVSDPEFRALVKSQCMLPAYLGLVLHQRALEARLCVRALVHAGLLHASAMDWVPGCTPADEASPDPVTYHGRGLLRGSLMLEERVRGATPANIKEVPDMSKPAASRPKIGLRDFVRIVTPWARVKPRERLFVSLITPMTPDMAYDLETQAAPAKHSAGLASLAGDVVTRCKRPVLLRDMQPLIEALIDRHPDLAQLRDNAVMRSRYVTLVLTQLGVPLGAILSSTAQRRDVLASNLADVFFLAATCSINNISQLSVAGFHRTHLPFSMASTAPRGAAPAASRPVPCRYYPVTHSANQAGGTSTTMVALPEVALDGVATFGMPFVCCPDGECFPLPAATSQPHLPLATSWTAPSQLACQARYDSPAALRPQRMLGMSAASSSIVCSPADDAVLAYAAATSHVPCGVAPAIMARAFLPFARPLAFGMTGRWRFEDYCWWTVACDLRTQDCAMPYWMRLMDCDGRGKLTHLDLEVAYEDRVYEIQSAAASGDSPASMSLARALLPTSTVLTQVLDIVKPAVRECITTADVRKAQCWQLLWCLLLSTSPDDVKPGKGVPIS